MQGITYIDLLNKVLPRLREQTVSSINQTTYSALVAGLINLVKDEVDSAWAWYDMRNDYTVNTVVGTQTYKVTGTNRKAQLVECWNMTTGVRLSVVPWQLLAQEYYSVGTGSVQTGEPTMIAYIGTDDSTGEATYKVFPQPDDVYELKLSLYAPSADLIAGTDVYKGPVRPIIEGALAYAYKERGEDGGMSSKEQFEVYFHALRDAVASEAQASILDTTWTTGA